MGATMSNDVNEGRDLSIPAGRLALYSSFRQHFIGIAVIAAILSLVSGYGVGRIFMQH